ncbi:MAG: cupin-like domain-containing protein [Patiriisocius sp.]|uniref:cupin-like domain-containing protein n=1 Tax=Patiriisocius sp. TaxID=2822396 RepID=UPI003EF6F416
MGKLKTIPVTTVDNLSKEDFVAQYLKPQRPVLIKGGWTKDWPAYNKWNIDYMQSLAGDIEVPLYNNEPTKGKGKSVAAAKHMRLYDYLEILKTQPTDLRMFFFNILDNLPQLLDDFKYPDVGMDFFKRLPVMFFGGKGSNVLAHYDMDLANLVHFHFHGHKRVLLFDPAQTKYMYRVPWSVHNLEAIDMDNPDFEKYPALKNLEATEVFMEHGDALFMPSGYWHYINYLDGGFSITLRSFVKKPGTLATMLYNVIILRNFENLMRKSFGQKWVDYKEEKMVKKVNKKFGNTSANA